MSAVSKHGFLILNKPVGERSTHCVETVRHILGKKTKVGHGGTLDSTASGVLVVLIGAATRLSNIVMGLPKCYETVVEFGAETDTDDASGEITRRADCSGITSQEIDKALAQFSGWRLQTPPSVSAVHIDGKRAHEIARAGGQTKIEPKAVYFEKVMRTDALSDNKVSFKIYCQKGTYIRSFGRDLGRALNSAAHIVKLRRKYVGAFNIEQSVDFCEIEKMSAADIYAALTPLEVLKSALPAYIADESAQNRLKRGGRIELNSVSRTESANMENYFGDQAIVMNDSIFSICSYEADGGKVFLKPSVNLFLSGDKA